ncbi:MerR family transcriptional regulator [Salinibacterium sp. dk2585]|uniref:MerR family transcriptional regulator n=1 Tax=unclassified Salinibacterium TaxID=2632331 RepID=UPI0011C2541D|nr:MULTISPECIES: MerR family transcriptional regulator [unclassified Salinibacterium]QEE60466.1 MerR family transcriptional regulator [Salinibacterium sp. dk2585]TXK55539.1 MerR family transcriptional regulator [Salinibacterium sp. dk5596]
MDWSIQQVASLAGTTSRTLRHYADIGLLTPSRVGTNGYRYYDAAALTRLQRILLLRELGLGLPAIAEVLKRETSAPTALATHLQLLRDEQQRLDRQIAAVEKTITKLREGEPLMADEMFDGFDHTQYKEEVSQRWGAEAYASGDRWWKTLTDADRSAFMQRQKQIQADYASALAAGEPADGDVAQEITARQVEWIAIGWQGRPVTAEAIRGLGQMYVDDPRFGANYGGPDGAAYVRDAMEVYASRLP